MAIYMASLIVHMRKVEEESVQKSLLLNIFLNDDLLIQAVKQ